MTVEESFNDKLHLEFQDWEAGTWNLSGFYCGIPVSFFLAQGPIPGPGLLSVSLWFLCIA